MGLRAGMDVGGRGKCLRGIFLPFSSVNTLLNKLISWNETYQTPEFVNRVVSDVTEMCQSTLRGET